METVRLPAKKEVFPARKGMGQSHENAVKRQNRGILNET